MTMTMVGMSMETTFDIAGVKLASRVSVMHNVDGALEVPTYSQVLQSLKKK